MTEKLKERKTIDDYEVGDEFITDNDWGYGKIIKIARKTKTQLVMEDGNKYKPYWGSNRVSKIGGYGGYSARFSTKELIDKRDGQVLVSVFENHIKWKEFTLDQLKRIKAITLEAKND